MISESRFVDILQKLATKSKANQVKWERWDEDGSYQVLFPFGAYIDISFVSPESDADWAAAALYSGEKQLVRIVLEDGSEQFPLVKGLYEDADRIYWGWDTTLKQIEDALKSEGTVGELRDKLTMKDPAKPKDDIPF